MSRGTATSVSAEELEELLTRCALGNRGAFETLYNATSAQLFAVLIRICQNKHLAEDVLHDAFLRIWQKSGDFRPGRGAPLTWMISIARYRAIDVLRRENRLTTESAIPEPVAPEGDTPDSQVASNQSAAALTTCLNELSEDQQQSLRLAYLGGLTHAQTAARMSRPEGTVKSWIRRSFKTLRKCLNRLASPAGAN